MGNLAKIDHIVVLMLENRSFDNLLGRLYPKSSGFDGLSGTETNPGPNGTTVQVWSNSGTDPATMTIPDPDPGELWTDMNMQIFGAGPQPQPPVANMSGFVANYVKQPPAPGPAPDPRAVMHYFTPLQVPVISTLARQFAVSDRWHASAPCQTWPNRFFVHTATANGYENNEPVHFPYMMPTIFNRFPLLEDPAWKIYFHDTPQAITLARLLPHLERFRLYDDFRYDAASGTLPAYSFIEPRYFADFDLPNDEHPPHIVTLGEHLIADVYNCLRNGPGWTKTLLIVTCDEHGGCYDHVPPTAAKPPGPDPTKPFNFDRYGVRVPAVLASPYIKQGTVLRPPGTLPFDHTSIIATLRKRFDLGGPLTARDAVAPDLESVLTLSAPSNLGPTHLEPIPYVPSPAEVAVAQNRPLNSFQHAMLKFAEYLPETPHPHLLATLTESQLRTLSIGAGPVTATTSLEAIHILKRRLGALFQSL